MFTAEIDICSRGGWWVGEVEALPQWFMYDCLWCREQCKLVSRVVLRLLLRWASGEGAVPHRGSSGQV